MTEYAVRLFGSSLLMLMAPLAVLAQPVPQQNPVAQQDAPGANPRVAITVSVEGDDGRRNDLGKIVIELYPTEAPRHTENFLKLARDGFYTGLTFHRIVPAFVIQGGDPMSRSNWQSNRLGTGGPGYNLPAEISRKHMRGAVAAARKNDPTVNPNLESSGSQFYICLADLPSLDRARYTVFGQVVEGMEVVDSIARVKNTGPQQNQALQRVTMTQVRVLE
ncbi:MAG TPA: peptidylprolyl isomerase [Candidatus Eisenbacteria bacterium]|nr:peptidylprolyl isomerase [Candidatus Eisenbacteria bacterium]